ncbi:LOW QUALITY PROTEIN: hypothetical protein HID58_001149 [Brassica napus]|uniref:Non-specific serine/threonine protein kinase n=2 Tax=Brassica TaxID=3705 RepID=A0ABQ8EJN0_BRANA|nr:LOW QUALITY PROTEIN: hypothetical protein HID58_001149 [Brassica napus]
MEHVRVIFFYFNCVDRGNFTANSSFAGNLNRLVSSLSSLTSKPYGFYNLSSGDSSGEKAYAIGLCRREVKRDDCLRCIQTAARNLTEQCPRSKQAVVWYTQCMFRYSNRTIYGRKETDPTLSYRAGEKISSNIDEFERLQRELLNRLKGIAAAGGGNRKYAQGNSSGSPGYRRFYGSAQCTPDLSEEDCNDCLIYGFESIPSCCDSEIGLRWLCPSCNFRFETWRFYEFEADLEADPPGSAGSPTPAARTEEKTGKSKGGSKVVFAIVIPIVLVALFAICLCLGLKWKKNKSRDRVKVLGSSHLSGSVAEDEFSNTDSLLVDFENLKAATNNFSPENELGRGGFGSVYKGVFSHGQEIAVKRLSGTSGQGDLEFKNEILLLAKLQHRNLVRLLGFCIHGQERLLVYEFIKNASLDHFIFEYAMHGQFSVKTDVFSFGVLVIEIITETTMVEEVWRSWREDVILSVIDPSLTTGSRNDILRCIHIGLLCVQESAASRPTMASVALMLNSNSFTLPTPSRPAFVLESVIPSNVSSSTEGLQMSSNDVTKMKIIFRKTLVSFPLFIFLFLYESSTAQDTIRRGEVGSIRDTGNFELIEVTSERVIWESFNHPTDTFLPNMRVRVNPQTGDNLAFVSWRSENDPSPGNFSLGVDPSGAPEIVLWGRNNTRRWRSGQWNSAIFTGIPNMALLTNYLYGFKLSSPPDETGSVYFTYVPSDPSVLLRFKVLHNGTEEELRWNETSKRWTKFQAAPESECDKYNRCGSFGICNMKGDNGICSCVDGYEPVSVGNWSRGCRRRTPLKCERRNVSNVGEDEFLTLKSVKLPDFETPEHSLADPEECKDRCLNNCSCTAFTFVNGIGCMIWNQDLVDLQQFEAGGSSLHVRLADSEIGESKKTKIVVIVAVLAGVVLLDTTAAFTGSVDIMIEGKAVNTSELPVFCLNVIVKATNDFSRENELGRGGFGPVYKGVLEDGQEIAVKRLSGKSGQGVDEFKNEIILIAKLQHRNLVRLLGCCFEGEEKMLVYEYMPNKSLDFFIFDETKQGLVDGKLRFAIIEGIARGLLYLHRDSRLRIIHRDLKVSNVLLDGEMIPKISDFGMARIFGGNQNEANTVRVAWFLYTHGRSEELVDPKIRATCNKREALRCIHVAMLCVQDSAAERPNMAAVLLMLESDTATLPVPRQPTFTTSTRRNSMDVNFALDSSQQYIVSSNEITSTVRERKNKNTRMLCGDMRGVLFSVLLLFPAFSFSANTLSATESLTISSNKTISSPGNIFELGFFKPSSSSRWYLGIWYKAISKRTYAWVANRDHPLSSSIGTLKISDSNLVVVDGSDTAVWSTNLTGEGDVRAPVMAELLDNGNLVLRDSNNNDPDGVLWQSFDFPTDTLLPEMKLGWDLKTGFNRFLRSWKSPDDPSSGDYSFKLETRGFPEAFLWNKASQVYRSGPWNGIRFSGVPEMQPFDYIEFNFTTSNQEVTYSFHITKDNMYSRLSLSSTGSLQRFTWIEAIQNWNQFWYAPKDQCDEYKECGTFGYCDSNTYPVCNCMRGFEPRNPQAWGLRDGSDGCVRKTALSCNGGDGFVRLKKMKLPDTAATSVDRGIGIKECEEKCKSDCNCTAFANTDIRGGGSGCVVWTGDILDTRNYAKGGQDLYVRLAATDLEDTTNRNAKIIGSCIGVSVLLLLCFIFYRFWKRKQKRSIAIETSFVDQVRSQDLLMNEVVIPSRRHISRENKTDDLELPLMDFEAVAIATDNFTNANKLGQGGFGIVYKGRLLDGQEIAVKRLSKMSVQGTDEFKNEVKLIARLQHINLVRLLGCCVDEGEKMLIYEYLENLSLDSHLFDKTRSCKLNWQKRFDITNGIARGLLYLHQDSRFRIIHRDLKASNVLLDKDMTPKISDFGMARIFGRDETEANTRKVVGTYGYMSPEYAMDGIFSTKSDVFSFGVLLLEIISGKRNKGFYNSDHDLNLLGCVWRNWKKGKGLDIVDPIILDSSPSTYRPLEILRCIKIGLLCVQERANDRPTMSSVVMMLGSETAAIPQPEQPGYCVGRSPLDTDSSSSNQRNDESWSVNQMTVSVIDPR